MRLFEEVIVRPFVPIPALVPSIVTAKLEANAATLPCIITPSVDKAGNGLSMFIVVPGGGFGKMFGSKVIVELGGAVLKAPRNVQSFDTFVHADTFASSVRSTTRACGPTKLGENSEVLLLESVAIAVMLCPTDN